jgi:sec-independent protein translocase protein TatB
MFDIGWSELLLIGAVALVVIGPKDLPRALRTVGQFTTKLKRMAGEFQSQFNEAMREAELDDIRRSVETVRDTTRGFNPLQTVREELRNTIESRPSSAPTAEEAAIAFDPPSVPAGASDVPASPAVPAAGTVESSTPQPAADLALPAVPAAPEPAKVIAAEAKPAAAASGPTADKPARKAPAKRAAKRGAPDELTALAETGPATPRKPRTRKAADAPAAETTTRAPRKRTAAKPSDGSSGEGSAS